MTRNELEMSPKKKRAEIIWYGVITRHNNCEKVHYLLTRWDRSLNNVSGTRILPHAGMLLFLFQLTALMNSQTTGLPPGIFECDSLGQWRKIRHITMPAFTNRKLRMVITSISPNIHVYTSF